MMLYYLMSGAAHCPYLVVSLMTLRRHYNGEVVVHAWPESFDFVRQICADARLGATAVQRVPRYRGKNDQFLDKVRMMCDIPRPTIYLDADTSVHGNIDQILKDAELFGLCATQFCDWVASGSLIKKRVDAVVRCLDDIHPSVVHASQYDHDGKPMPSVNGGVFAAASGSIPMLIWEKWTTAAAPTAFIADEAALHLVQGRYADTAIFNTLRHHGAYNCSPKHQSKALADADVRIYHYHGDCATRPDKCPRGVAMWLDLYKQALAENYGDINAWRSRTGNKYLDGLDV